MGTINKTEQQQIQHSKMMAETRDILEKHGVNPILTGSALMGIMRSGDLVPWVPGVVFTVLYAEIIKNESIILEDFEKHGFTIAKHWPGQHNYKIRINRHGLNIEITGFSKRKKNYIRKLKRKIKIIPGKFLDAPHGEIELRGEKYKTPFDIEGFLNFIYLDWKTPTKSTRPATYKTKNHMVTSDD